MTFAALHCHSEYSVRDSLIRIEELPRIAKAKGWDAVALTDHGGVEGMWHFLKACRAEKIRPIAGIELYVGVPDSKKSHHLTILAKNAKGFSSILRALSDGHRDHYHDKKKHAALPMIRILGLEEVIVLSGCYSSPFWRESPQAAADLAMFVERFGEDFFFEVQALHDWNGQTALNPVVLEMARLFQRPAVVTPDCHFGTSDEGCFHDALLAVSNGIPVQSPKAWKFSTKLNWIMSPAEIGEGLSRAGFPADEARKAVENTGRVLDRISDWDWKDLPAPGLPVIEGSLSELARSGLAIKGFDTKPSYVDRLDYELGIFEKAGIGNYLLLVKKCIDLFRSEGAEIGPRGSVGGSLVAYVLGIATMDPVEHDLIVERFIAPGRTTAPDVDLDVNTRFRERVPDVLRKEFGSENVAQISNYGTFGLRQAIRDACRAYGVGLQADISDIEYRRILQDHDNNEEKVEFEALRTWQELLHKSPDAANFAKKLRGRVRQFGAHAGGFVISSRSLAEGRSAIVTRGTDKALVWDMEVAESLGFVKMDFLGLDALEAVRRIKDAGVDIGFGKIPMDDPKVYEDLASGRTAGIPQFLTSGLRMFLEALKPKEFKDLVWAAAAFRPGALGQYSPRELADRYRDNPDSLIVYQEDIMAICVHMAGFSWADADRVRKVVAKKEGKAEWGKWAGRFADGCVSKNSMDREGALLLWSRLEEFTRYAFPKSHANSYSGNSYRIAWAKRNHPLIAFAALLNADSDAAESLRDEAHHFGVKIEPANVNLSEADEWAVREGWVLAPLSSVHGSDLRIAKAIIRRRIEGGPFFNEADFEKRMEKIQYHPNVKHALFGRPLAGYNKLTRPVKTQWKGFLDVMKGCMECGLRNHCNKVVPTDLGKTNVLLVGEAPGRDEDRSGRPFTGPSGELLFGILKEHGIDRSEITITNSAHCKPPFISEDSEGPYTRAEIDKMIVACPWLPTELETLKPPLVFAVGRKAWEKLGGEGGITKACGTVIEHKDGYRIVASVHPAFVLRDPSMRPELERAVAKFARLFREIVPGPREDTKAGKEIG